MAYPESGERWLKHYSSFHQILLVGEGDFSFSLSLALSFGDASNIVATSFDSYDSLIKKYKNVKYNLLQLETLGASLIHEVDATKMKLHPDLNRRRFDRIIYNFPHAGFHGKEDHARMIKMHRNLVLGFFHNAAGMLRADGEVHVSHKTSPPFSHWNLEELASKTSLTLIERADFRVEDYPGYANKRGDGPRSDKPFPLGKCCTFKFVISPAAHKGIGNQQRPSYSGHRPLDLVSFSTHQGLAYGHFQPHFGLADGSSAVYHVFEWFLNHVKETNGRPDKCISLNTHFGIRRGYERYVSLCGAENPAGFTNFLMELHRLTRERLAWLEDQLVNNQRALGWRDYQSRN